MRRRLFDGVIHKLCQKPRLRLHTTSGSEIFNAWWNPVELGSIPIGLTGALTNRSRSDSE